MSNYAFIDGQNLHLGTTKADVPWRVDLRRFRVYLEQKHRVSRARYFIGTRSPEHTGLYQQIADAGFELEFREHSDSMVGKKKGNVDVDIVFSVMAGLYLKDDFDKIVLVSGDGDYKRMVDFLIAIGRFEKVLFPCHGRASSLYKTLTHRFYSYLDDPGMKVKFGSPQK